MSRKDITDADVIRACQLSAIALNGAVYVDVNGSNLKWNYEFLQSITGQCQKVCWRAIERTYKRGYIDYGVSLRTAWVTNKGLAKVGSTTRYPLV